MNHLYYHRMLSCYLRISSSSPLIRHVATVAQQGQTNFLGRAFCLFCDLNATRVLLHTYKSGGGGVELVAVWHFTAGGHYIVHIIHFKGNNKPL